MTERERALTYLRDKQLSLALARRHGYRDIIEYWELEVCAALSWLWDAQERAFDTIDDQWRESITRRIKADPKIYFP